jgi:cytidylate kinase
MKITISGLPGAGKDILRRKLEKEYVIPSFSIGDLRREYAKKMGMDIQKFNKYSEKNPEGDIQADNYQKEWAKKHKDFILDGRLSYHFIPESIRIFLAVSPEIGAKRIFQEKRKSEKKVSSILDQKKLNLERCISDVERYKERYGIKNCYDENNFDIIIDTTKRSQEETVQLAKIKILDYEQKMNPPIFYFGHPTRAKNNTELNNKFNSVAQNANIQFFNPFTDNLFEKENSHGEKDYKNLTQKGKEKIAEGDLLAVLDKKIIGGIFVYNGDFTVATQMESMTDFYAGKLNYIVTQKGEREKGFLYHHPFFRKIQTKIFPDLEKLENYLIKHRNDLFIKLRKTRELWMKDSTCQGLYEEMKANELYLGR